MRKLLATVLGVTTVVALSASAGMGQTSCPPEVASAKAMLTHEGDADPDRQQPGRAGAPLAGRRAVAGATGSS